MLKLDALFNFMGVLLFFLFVLLAQVNPKAEEQIDPPGNLVASIAWPQGSIDVDLWVLAPNDKAVGYSNKAGRVWNLLRDDLGTANDPALLNYESAFTRGLPDGEYVINVRCFGCAGHLPVPVSTEVRLADGGLVWRGVVDLVADKQERTAVRFKVSGGKVVPGSESHVLKEIRRTT